MCMETAEGLAGFCQRTTIVSIFGNGMGKDLQPCTGFAVCNSQLLGARGLSGLALFGSFGSRVARPDAA